MGQVQKGSDQTSETISVTTLDSCPICGLEWKYKVLCEKCQGEGCEHTEEEHSSWCSHHPEGKHSPHVCIGGERGPFSLLTEIEYSYGTPERYDGISEYTCPGCGTRWGRWTGKVLKKGELEPRFGGR